MSQRVYSFKVITHKSPEAAALAPYPPSALARVLSVEYNDDGSALVVVDTVPSYPQRAIVFRDQQDLWAFGHDL